MAPVQLPAFTDAYIHDEIGICNKALLRIGADIIRDTDEDTKQMRVCKSVYEVSRMELLRSFAFPFSVKTAVIPNISTGLPIEPYSYSYDIEDFFEFSGDVSQGSYFVTNVTLPPERTNSFDIVGRTVTSPLFNKKAKISAFDASTNTIGLDTILIPDGTPVPPETGVVFGCMLPVIRVIEVNSKKDAVYEVAQSGAGAVLLTDETAGMNAAGPYLVPIKYIADIKNPSFFDAMFTDLLILKIAIKISMALSQKPSSIVAVLQQEYVMNMRLAMHTVTSERQTDVPDAPWTKTPWDRR